MDRTSTVEHTLTSVMTSTMTNLATTTVATTATATQTQVVMETMLGGCLQKVRAQVVGRAADLTRICSVR